MVIAIVLLWLVWTGTMLVLNDTTPGTSWPYDGSCYRTDEGFLTCGDSPSAGGVCTGGEGGCSCDGKFGCDGCHAEYPHDMGFVVEKVGSGFACVPECVFAGGVVNYDTSPQRVHGCRRDACRHVVRGSRLGWCCVRMRVAVLGGWIDLSAVDRVRPVPRPRARAGPCSGACVPVYDATAGCAN